MKKSKLLLIIFGIVLVFVSLFSNYIINYEKIDTLFIVNENSKAYEYAKDKNNEILNDSNKDIYIRNLEEFTYNEVLGGLELVGYKGISKELVIPEYINSKKVVSINFDLTNIDTLIISSNIKNINELGNTKLVCYQNSLCEESLIADSDYNKYFYNYDIDFTYNIVDNKIQIESYTGNDKFVIIPTTINGYEVSSVSFDLNNIDKVYIPSTVTNIEFSVNSIDTLFVIISILSLLIYLIVLLISGKTINSTSIYVVSSLYLISSVILPYLIYGKLLVIVYIILTAIYLLLSLSLIMTKGKLDKYDNKIKNIDTFIKECLLILDSYDGLNLEKLKELIKYSDPVSSDSTKELENEILNDLKKLNNDTDIELVSKKIKTRNQICKDNK